MHRKYWFDCKDLESSGDTRGSKKIFPKILWNSVWLNALVLFSWKYGKLVVNGNPASPWSITLQSVIQITAEYIINI
jgi:hypothetical protein